LGFKITLSRYRSKVEVDFGAVKFVLDFKDNTTMTFTGTAGSSKNSTDTVSYTAVEVAKNVFMVYWHEPHLGFNVTHIQDYNKNIVYSNIADQMVHLPTRKELLKF
jgi:hypothetical protein